LTTFRSGEQELAVVVAAHSLIEAAEVAIARWADHDLQPADLIAVDLLGPALLAVPPRDNTDES
jgi:hypothetical protein